MGPMLGSKRRAAVYTRSHTLPPSNNKPAFLLVGPSDPMSQRREVSGHMMHTLTYNKGDMLHFLKNLSSRIILMIGDDAMWVRLQCGSLGVGVSVDVFF